MPQVASRFVVVAGCIGAMLGCRTDAIRTATSLTFLSHPQNAAAAAVLAPAIQVAVLDQDGNVFEDASAPITISITSGTGTSGALLAGTLSRAPISGIAAFEGLSIAKAGALYTLSATASGLTSATSQPFNVAAGAAATISAASTATQNATVGTAVSSAPAVTVADSHGNGVSGVQVIFTVTSGGGNLGSGTITTASEGLAQVSSWTLGTTAGLNSVSATATGLSGSPVHFTATGIAGPPASIAIANGNNQSAEIGTALAIAPAVTVRDAHTNAVSGATVQFSPGNNGSVTGGLALTNAAGTATVGGWVLGPIPGLQTLSASLLNTPSLAVTFNATATGCPNSNFFFGFTAQQELTTSDCTTGSPAFYYDQFAFEVASGPTPVFLLTGGSGDPEWTLMVSVSLAGWGGGKVESSGGGFHIAAGPGVHRVIATSSLSGRTGAYTLGSNSNSFFSQCGDILVSKGMNVSHSLNLNCNYARQNGELAASKRYLIFVPEGAVATFRMTSSAFTPALECFDVTGRSQSQYDSAPFVAGCLDTGGVLHIQSAPAGRLIMVRATQTEAPQVGSYTLAADP